jgi:hypothetical protein
MSRKIEPGSVVATPSDRRAVVISGEKRGKKFYYQLEDEEGNRFEHIETGLTLQDSTPAELAAIEEPTVKNPLTSMMGFPKFRQQHPIRTAKLPDGKARKVQDNEDHVAFELLAWTLDGKDLFLFPDVVEAGESDVLRTRYSSLNKGMQRMNVGNKVRGYRSKVLKESSDPKAKVIKGEKSVETSSKEEATV